AWSLDVDLIERDHVAPEDHRLQVEATALGQEARHPLEEVPVDPLLTPGAVLLGRAEVLEGAEARRGVESAEGLRVDLARVREGDIEATPLAPRARMKLSSGPHPHPRSSTRAPGLIPICSATYSCLRRCASSRVSEKSPSYLAPLKSASSPRLRRKTRSVSE